MEGGQVQFLASGRRGRFFGLRQGGRVFFDAEKYKSPAPQAVNS